MGWNGILVEQHQYPSRGKTEEKELPALSDHWLILPLGHPTYISQKSDDRMHESIFQKGDSLLVPAGQPSCWRCPGSETSQTELYIHLQPKLIAQVTETAEIGEKRLNLVNHFGQQDLQLQHIAMLLLAELRSGGIMGQLYVESLSQALVIHLLRHYAEVSPIVITENKSLTYSQVQKRSTIFTLTSIEICHWLNWQA